MAPAPLLLLFPLSTYHVYFFPFAQDTKHTKTPKKANRQAGKYATNSHSKHARKFLQFAGWIKKGKSWEKSRGDGGGSPRPGDAKPMPSVIE